jgi:hypothetical protein
MPPRNRAQSGRSGNRADTEDAAARNGHEADARSEASTAERGRDERVGVAGLRLPMPAGVDGKRLLWFGGLGALATIGLLDWPVAVVVGAGSIIASRFARDEQRRRGD